MKGVFDPGHQNEGRKHVPDQVDQINVYEYSAEQSINLSIVDLLALRGSKFNQRIPRYLKEVSFLVDPVNSLPDEHP